MKRIFSLLLIGCILAFSLAPAASASEVPTPELMELLEMESPNGSSNRRAYRETGALNVAANFSLSVTFTFYYIDVLFSVPSGYTPDSVWLSMSKAGAVHTDLELINVSGNIWRAYGSTEYNAGGFFLHFTGGMPWVEFSSVRIASSPLTGIDERAQCEITAYNYHVTINYIPTDIINYRSFLGASTPELNNLLLFIECDNWRKYDYLDFTLSCDVGTISSISAGLGDSVVPFSSSVITSSGGIENHYLISVRLDLTNINRSSTESLFLEISGSVNLGSDNFISMEGCRGYIVSASSNPLFMMIQRLSTQMSSGFANVYMYLRDISEAIQGNVATGDKFKQDSSALVSDLDDVSDSLNSVVKPDLEAFDLTGLADSPDASFLMSGLFTPFVSNEYFFIMFMINLLLCLVAYLLYGKG